RYFDSTSCGIKPQIFSVAFSERRQLLTFLDYCDELHSDLLVYLQGKLALTIGANVGLAWQQTFLSANGSAMCGRARYNGSNDPLAVRLEFEYLTDPNGVESIKVNDIHRIGTDSFGTEQIQLPVDACVGLSADGTLLYANALVPEG